MRSGEDLAPFRFSSKNIGPTTTEFVLEFPSFTIRNGWHGRSVQSLGIPKSTRIDNLINTYSGRIYLFMTPIYI